MKNPIGYLHLLQPSLRLELAEIEFMRSLSRFPLEPVPVPAGRKLAVFGEVLSIIRKSSTGHAFVWCNSDLILNRDPFEVPNPDCVYGFYRKEIPSGEITHGVDMYYIPIKWWDEYLSKDIPKLYLGASYVDWWISRAMQKVRSYDNLEGYIDHISHPQSDAAGNDANRFYQTNFRSYNKWAKRNGLSMIPAPPYLIPCVGHVWGLRDLLNKAFSRFISH